MKIGQYLAKIWQEYSVLLFLRHGVYIYCKEIKQRCDLSVCPSVRPCLAVCRWLHGCARIQLPSARGAFRFSARCLVVGRVVQQSTTNRRNGIRATVDAYVE